MGRLVSGFSGFGIRADHSTSVWFSSNKESRWVAMSARDGGRPRGTKKSSKKNHIFLRMVAAVDWQRQRLVPLRRLELLPGKHPGRLSRLLADRRLAGDRLGPERALHLPHALARGGLLVGRRLWLVRKPFFLSLSLSPSLSLSLARSLAPCCHSLPAATRSLLPLAPCCHSLPVATQRTRAHSRPTLAPATALAVAH